MKISKSNLFLGFLVVIIVILFYILKYKKETFIGVSGSLASSSQILPCDSDGNFKKLSSWVRYKGIPIDMSGDASCLSKRHYPNFTLKEVERNGKIRLKPNPYKNKCIKKENCPKASVMPDYYVKNDSLSLLTPLSEFPNSLGALGPLKFNFGYPGISNMPLFKQESKNQNIIPFVEEEFGNYLRENFYNSAKRQKIKKYIVEYFEKLRNKIIKVSNHTLQDTFPNKIKSIREVFDFLGKDKVKDIISQNNLFSVEGALKDTNSDGTERTRHQKIHNLFLIVYRLEGVKKRRKMYKDVFMCKRDKNIGRPQAYYPKDTYGGFEDAKFHDKCSMQFHSEEPPDLLFFAISEPVEIKLEKNSLIKCVNTIASKKAKDDYKIQMFYENYINLDKDDNTEFNNKFQSTEFTNMFESLGEKDKIQFTNCLKQLMKVENLLKKIINEKLLKSQIPGSSLRFDSNTLGPEGEFSEDSDVLGDDLSSLKQEYGIELQNEELKEKLKEFQESGITYEKCINKGFKFNEELNEFEGNQSQELVQCNDYIKVMKINSNNSQTANNANDPFQALNSLVDEKQDLDLKNCSNDNVFYRENEKTCKRYFKLKRLVDTICSNPSDTEEEYCNKYKNLPSKKNNSAII